MLVVYPCLIHASSHRALSTITTCNGSSSMRARTLSLLRGTSAALTILPYPFTSRAHFILLCPVRPGRSSVARHSEGMVSRHYCSDSPRKAFRRHTADLPHHDDLRRGDCRLEPLHSQCGFCCTVTRMPRHPIIFTRVSSQDELACHELPPTWLDGFANQERGLVAWNCRIWGDDMGGYMYWN